MKRLYSFFVGVVAIIFILWGISWRLSAETASNTNQIVVYNWGDYIDPNLIDKFTEETGIQVRYETFDSNEAMYTKIKQGGTTYDIVVPSDYMITRMSADGLLYDLDHSKLVGLENIDERLLDQSFDEGNRYSIPYFWGTLGIVYNEDLVETAPEHWSDLWKEEYRNSIMLYDGAREVMGLGLNSQGYSLNSRDEEELAQTVDKLYELTPNIKALVADEMKGYMIQGDGAIGVTFSGEAVTMLEGNESLHYVVPPEASNLWFDNLVIPKVAKNVDGAYAFINFMLEPENAYQNSLYIGYSTPNKVAREMLPDDVKNDPAFYPDEETMENLEVYDALDKRLLGLYNDLFLQVKMYRK